MASRGGHYEIEIPKEPRPRRRISKPIYKTALGAMYCGKSERVLKTEKLKALHGSAQLVFTSPPFPLNTKKRYGNLQGDEYVRWFARFAPLLKDYLTPDGSIVIEIGNAWEPGRPVMSTTVLKAFLRFLEKGGLHLCQEFIWYNSARLPSPIEWVNKERIRVKDAFTRIWWMSPTDRPKADNRRVLREYSPSMKRLIETGKYNAGPRPSENHIGAESFKTNNNGAIPPNVLGADDLPTLGSVLKAANTRSHDQYRTFCKEKDVRVHPARMPRELVEFFLKFLTDEDDLVIDPFAGSNTTGSIAEEFGRRWISIEAQWEYAAHSISRFDPESVQEVCADLKLTKQAEPEQVDHHSGRPLVSGAANASSS